MQVACRSKLVRTRSYRIVVRGPAWEAASCIQGGGDERMAKGAGADLLGDAGAARHTADDPGGAVPVQPPPGSLAGSLLLKY
jgi:hypothetical protein